MTNFNIPGDYPDRSVWLAKRHTPRNLRRGRLIWSSVEVVEAGDHQHGTLVGRTMKLGVNKAKRFEEIVMGGRHRRIPRRSVLLLGSEPIRGVLHQRHMYRAQRYEARQS